MSLLSRLEILRGKGVGRELQRKNSGGREVGRPKEIGESGSKRRTMDVTRASTSEAASSSVTPSFHSIFHHFLLISALVAFAVAQSAKLFTTWHQEKRWDPKQLVGSGGMPSSHSATVAALAAATGFQDGFRGSIFATAMILACVVMYDAFGVRLHAGRQAEVLNQIVYELPAEHRLADTRPLRELLGHTPPQGYLDVQANGHANA